MAMKTPGVYIVEKNAFPNSVVEVATAVPAFIGYTEKADNGGVSLTGKAWRIASMAEYERYFGLAPEPVFQLVLVDDAKAADKAAVAGKKTTADQKLTEANGKAAGDKKTLDGSPAGMAVKKAQDAFDAAKKPDATDEVKKGLPAAEKELDQAKAKLTEAPEYATWQKSLADAQRAETAALNAAMAVALVGAATADLAPKANMDKPRVQVSEFKRNGKTYRLTRQPGKAGNRFLMHQAMRHFFQNGGGPCYVVSVGGYDMDIEAGDDKKGLVSGLGPLVKEQEPTMVLTPDAVSLTQADCRTVQQAALKHCGYEMKNRVAILDIWGGDRDRQDPAGSCIDDFRNGLGIEYLDFAAAYYPWLHTSLLQANDFRYWMFDKPASVAALIWDELAIADAGADDKRARQRLDALAVVARDWKQHYTDQIDANADLDDAAKAAAKKVLDDPRKVKKDSEAERMLLDKALHSMSELYGKVRDEALGLMNLMAPAAAMAGLYTMVDNTRGVWKAPANVSVAGVIRPAVEISHADQGDLNVTTQGKSINAIRSFIGEGVLVWGARTLDGNSLDWRYVNVRRTMIMLEESCRLAAKAMVFEPNVANTWVTIKSMISNFLTGIWKRGGLAGAVPDDAFSVHVGLGETMTPEDILEGILRVTVLVAISRPAEFIEITFQQQMQKS